MPTKTKREKLAISFFQNAGEDIRQNITILAELQNLIPPLAEEEFEQLKQNILTNGCREPLILWRRDGQSVLVDGHNRYRICTENNVAFEFMFYDFDSLDHAKDWMLANQLGRRNLTALQQSYLRGKRYANEKQAHGGLRVTRDRAAPTATQLAQEYGVNEKTVRRDEQFALGLDKLTKDDDSLRWKILKGQVKAGKKTIADLAEAPAAHLRRLNRKLAGTPVDDTPDLDLAVKQFRLAEQTAGRHSAGRHSADDTQPVITPTLASLKKQITTTTTRAIRTGDPTNVARLRQLVDQLEQALQ